MKKIITILGLLFLFNLSVNSQISNQDKANLYIKEALISYEKLNYSTAIEYLTKAETLLESSNSEILFLKMVSYLNTNQFILSKECYDQFNTQLYNNSNQETRDKFNSYLVRIEKGRDKELDSLKEKKTKNQRAINELDLLQENQNKYALDQIRQKRLDLVEKGDSFSPSLKIARIKEAENYRFILENGEYAFQSSFDLATKFIGGQALVKNRGEIFFIDEKGNSIKKTNYREMTFMGKYIAVLDTRGWKIINLEDESVFPGFYLDVMYSDEERYAALKSETGWGIVNSQGTWEENTPFIYEDVDIENIAYNKFIVKLNGKWGMVDDDGNIVLKFKYSRIRKYASYGSYYIYREGKKRKRIFIEYSPSKKKYLYS